MEGREFDLILFGFTSFTGYYAARELLLNIREVKDPKIQQIKWAVAGRSVEKLQETLIRLNDELKFDHESITKIYADAMDQDSLVKMAARTTILVNNVGPYRFYGKQVVEACVQARTHHLDISAEPQYIEQSVLDYYKTSKNNKTLVISTCGWDCIPSDIGVDYLKRNFNGTLHSVDSFARIIRGPKGYSANIGTTRSLIYEIIYGVLAIKAIRKQLRRDVYKMNIPKSRIKASRRYILFKNDKVDGVNIFFPVVDEQVVRRSQYHMFEEFKERKVQMRTYWTDIGYLYMIGLMFLILFSLPFFLFPCGRRFLEKYSWFFTLNNFTKDGPTREQVDTTRFQNTLIGKGWSEKVDDPYKEPKGKMDKQVVLRIEGEDPGYKATGTFIIQSALTVFLERENMPEGGVLTPAFAFRKTSFVERLQSRGIKFILE